MFGCSFEFVLGVLVAHAAKEEMVRNPDNTIFNAKRFIGRSYV